MENLIGRGGFFLAGAEYLSKDLERGRLRHFLRFAEGTCCAGAGRAADHKLANKTEGLVARGLDVLADY